MGRRRRRCSDCRFMLNRNCRSHDAKKYFSGAGKNYGEISPEGRIFICENPADGSKPLKSLAEICPQYEKV